MDPPSLIYYSSVERQIGSYQQQINGYRPYNGAAVTRPQMNVHDRMMCVDYCTRDNNCPPGASLGALPGSDTFCNDECRQRCGFPYSSSDLTYNQNSFGPSIPTAVDWKGETVQLPPIPLMRDLIRAQVAALTSTISQ